ncbi:MAG: preprotein translocase subunit SecG [PS1 clade bacterium]|uniref:Protein-export membrane protein SecG n=1 Tax=PS1 clade bacterium TaxID=2175152 RepID=A0A937HG70_9PROT|nr:preprotein translocase subunit SecG [PS1 clade bacterium]
MTTILLVIHLMVAVAMIVLVLLQRSEGGALGIGGGSDGMMSARGLGNAMTQATAILAGVFFLTSIGLTVLGTMENRSSVLDGVIETDGPSSTTPQAPAPVLPDLNDLPTPE